MFHVFMPLFKTQLVLSKGFELKERCRPVKVLQFLLRVSLQNDVVKYLTCQLYTRNYFTNYEL
jgi:hypothetical protein